jgi:N,N'-diacetyllegionaminate synthase
LIFIAEIGLNYNSNVGLLHELIRQAKLAGADIVKFQLGWKGKKNEINHIDDKIIKLIIKISQFYEIEPMFSIFTNEALEMIKKYNFRRYKIASRTLVENFSLAKKIIAEKKETFVSLGFWKKKKLPFKKDLKIKYLWCKSIYPTAPWELKKFPKKFRSSDILGLSDHSIGIELSLIAISRGAQIIERHFTLDKSDTTIRDHALSLTPNEFKILVDNGKAIFKLLDKIK